MNETEGEREIENTHSLSNAHGDLHPFSRLGDAEERNGEGEGERTSGVMGSGRMATGEDTAGAPAPAPSSTSTSTIETGSTPASSFTPPSVFSATPPSALSSSSPFSSPATTLTTTSPAIKNVSAWHQLQSILYLMTSWLLPRFHDTSSSNVSYISRQWTQIQAREEARRRWLRDTVGPPHKNAPPSDDDDDDDDEDASVFLGVESSGDFTLSRDAEQIQQQQERLGGSREETIGEEGERSSAQERLMKGEEYGGKEEEEVEVVHEAEEEMMFAQGPAVVVVRHDDKLALTAIGDQFSSVSFLARPSQRQTSQQHVDGGSSLSSATPPLHQTGTPIIWTRVLTSLHLKRGDSSSPSSSSPSSPSTTVPPYTVVQRPQLQYFEKSITRHTLAVFRNKNVLVHDPVEAKHVIMERKMAFLKHRLRRRLLPPPPPPHDGLAPPSSGDTTTRGATNNGGIHQHSIIVSSPSTSQTYDSYSQQLLTPAMIQEILNHEQLLQQQKLEQEEVKRRQQRIEFEAAQKRLRKRKAYKPQRLFFSKRLYSLWKEFKSAFVLEGYPSLSFSSSSSSAAGTNEARHGARSGGAQERGGEVNDPDSQQTTSTDSSGMLLQSSISDRDILTLSRWAFFISSLIDRIGPSGTKLLNTSQSFAEDVADILEGAVHLLDWTKFNVTRALVIFFLFSVVVNILFFPHTQRIFVFIPLLCLLLVRTQPVQFLLDFGQGLFSYFFGSLTRKAQRMQQWEINDEKNKGRRKRVKRLREMAHHDIVSDVVSSATG